jgi:hypothetical protein
MVGRTLLAVLLGCAAAFAGRVRVANPDLLREISPEARRVIERQGMVACPTTAEQMYDLYIHAAEDDLPILVTVDPLLHTFHILYDYSLRTAELDHFYPEMERVLAGLLAFELDRYAQAQDTAIRMALAENIAYLSVPLALLRPGFEPPSIVADIVRRELVLIDGIAPAMSAVMGYREDFTQYRPRGHYTRNERFRRYFRAMMYLGRMTFRLRTAFGTPALASTRRTILLSDAFESATTDSGVPVKDLWQRVYDATTYMVGRSDDVLPAEYDRLARRLAGDAPLEQWAVDDNNVLKFCDAARGELAQPEVLSDFVDPGQPIPAGMRLMGQRFIPDARVFHNLTFDRIPDRLLPMSLDVMAALGSDRARELLIDVYHQDTFPGYVATLDSMRTVFAGFDSADWNQNAYYGWLHALKLNLEPVRHARRRALVARFLRSEAYPDKTLVTSCGSWAQLRHDTILYAKQSYTTAVSISVIPERRRFSAYVEAKPAVFRQVANSAGQLAFRLKSMGRLNVEVEQKLARLAETADRLAQIAQAELSGRQMSESDVDFCRGIGKSVKLMTTFSDQFGKTYLSEQPARARSAAAEQKSLPRLDAESGMADPVEAEAQRVSFGRTTNEDRRMALVADVHTEPNSGRVLEVAVGDPMRLYAVVPCWGRQYLAVGACFSFYEFTKPMSERMTDAEWQTLSPKPPMPLWTRSFVAP